MPSPDSQSDDDGGHPAIRCDDCQSALHAAGRQTVSFLLLDQLTVPIVGCDDHLEQFTEICGLTTEDTADLLDHLPAGGVGCPSCRLAPYEASQPMISVEDGAIAVTACPEHQSAIVERFRTGLETRQQLTADIDTATGSPL